jgi:hypothetical protein
MAKERRRRLEGRERGEGASDFSRYFVLAGGTKRAKVRIARFPASAESL